MFKIRKTKIYETINDDSVIIIKVYGNVKIEVIDYVL